MVRLIGLGTILYHLGIRLAAAFVPKARLWVEGRKGSWTRLEAKSAALQGCLWMHCASVGEFEQGRPVLEAIKKERPELPVLLTFFSPSGYEARKNFPMATHVEYLPPDSAANADRLLKLVRPKAVIFIKYEFWFEHLAALKRTGVPTFLVSAIFRPSQPFFRWYGAAHRTMLSCFARLFVQDDASRDLLGTIGVHNVIVSGDTRFDRVLAIVNADEEVPIARTFKEMSNGPVMVCGSTWPEDDRTLAAAFVGLKNRLSVIVAPHESSATQNERITRDFPPATIRWSAWSPSQMPAHTLLVDRMGLLSRLYKYGDVTYVGGGFGSGIHNTLEAAAWGKPVIFGPNYQRFAEARGLIDAGAGFSVKNEEELGALLQRFLNDPDALRTASEAASHYVLERTGATQRVLHGVLADL
ncbi:MAG TPA: glycosyltransferase N-terminal domain-containing protein [Flavobacteriales bacterium]|nr:glycosyltransferase N-terminal domain-containing protein [Flavobacteriales bacterium]